MTEARRMPMVTGGVYRWSMTWSTSSSVRLSSTACVCAHIAAA